MLPLVTTSEYGTDGAACPHACAADLQFECTVIITHWPSILSFSEDNAAQL